MLEKRYQENEKFLPYSDEKNLVEFDIEELDTTHNSMVDFLNNLEMGMHRLDLVESEIQDVRSNITLLDLCDSLCNKQNETRLTLMRANRLSDKAEQLKRLISKNEYQPIWFEGSCSEMLLRLNEIK